MLGLISSTYDDETGISTVVIERDGIHYTGIAKLHPEDRSRKSQIRGGYIAEYRAFIKYLKAELKKEKAELKYFYNIIQAVSSYKNFNSCEGTAKALYRQYNIKAKSVADLQDRIRIYKKALKNYIEAADNFKVKND